MSSVWKGLGRQSWVCRSWKIRFNYIEWLGSHRNFETYKSLYFITYFVSKNPDFSISFKFKALIHSFTASAFVHFISFRLPELSPRCFVFRWKFQGSQYSEEGRNKRYLWVATEIIVFSPFCVHSQSRFYSNVLWLFAKICHLPRRWSWVCDNLGLVLSWSFLCHPPYISRGYFSRHFFHDSQAPKAYYRLAVII